MNELQKQVVQSSRYIVVPAPTGKDIINFTKNAFEPAPDSKPKSAWSTVAAAPEKTTANKPTRLVQKPTAKAQETQKPVVTELFKGKEPITLAKLEQAALAKKRQSELGLEVFDLQDKEPKPTTPTELVLEPAFEAPSNFVPETLVEEVALSYQEITPDMEIHCESLCEDDLPLTSEADEVLPDLKALTELGIIKNEEIISEELQVSTAEPEVETFPLESIILTPAVPENLCLPSLDLLSRGSGVSSDAENEVFEKANLLEQTLASFGVQASITDFTRGPAITRFEIQPAPGVKVAKIVNLSDDLALSMAATDIRIEAPIPGKAAVGIEIPNEQRTAVTLREVVDTAPFTKHTSKLAVGLGVDIAGTPVIADLTKMPHLLIAGSTGSGKSVCINTIISSILLRATPDEVKFMMIDPKMVELSTFNGIPHLIAPVITDPRKATMALKWVVNEMESRYSLFATTGVRNITGFNEYKLRQNETPLPLIVVLIDELADLMMVASKDVEDTICRIAQMARAAGIHLVIATQRPSVDVITGIIKANIPSRIAFAVSSQADSRTILDIAGAEKLLGRGDMLFNPIGLPKPHRVQGAFVSDEEVFRIVQHWKKQARPEYETGIINLEANGTVGQGVGQEEDDELLPDAARLLIDTGQASVSMLQRRFRIGYNRAARLIDQLEEKGVVGPFEGSKPRAVLIDLQSWEQLFG